jgi:hypothetical protein
MIIYQKVSFPKVNQYYDMPKNQPVHEVIEKSTWGHIFSCVRPFYERAVNDLDP